MVKFKFKLRKKDKKKKEKKRKENAQEVELSVVHQPDIQEKKAPRIEDAAKRTKWDNGLYQCCEDCESCWYGFCCPTCAIASARTNMDGSNWCFNLMCLTVCTARFIVRSTYGIQGTGCWGDLCYTYWCGPCVTCQLYNEVETRGDPLPHTVRSRPHSGFHAGLTDCLNDPAICVRSCLCAQCAMADALNHLDQTDWKFACWCIPIPLGRNLLRKAYQIEEGESCAKDIILGLCCPQLVVCQMSNEIARRGKIVRNYKWAQEEEEEDALVSIQNPVHAQPPSQNEVMKR